MSQCVAPDLYCQGECEFRRSSMSGKKECMYKNSSFDDHCSSHKAQAYGHEHGVIGIDDIPMEDLTLDLKELFVDEEKQEGCRDCVWFACPYLNSLANSSKYNGHIGNEGLVLIASGCSKFETGRRIPV